MLHSIPVQGSRALAGASAALLLAVSVPAMAQDEDALRSSFEGKRVTLRIDMPGTSDGVDIHPDSPRPIDYSQYRDDLKKYGTAIRAGQSSTVTLVKVKKDHIEFQLGGGGFGTFWDDTSTSVHIPFVEKSDREKYLERRIKEEDDRRKRRELERELDDLRDRRETENRRILAARERAEERKRDRIANQRLNGGSRFNLRYSGSVPAGIRPEEVMAALAEYVDFGSASAHLAPPQADAPVADVLPYKGMLRTDAERAYGRPLESTSRRSGDLTVTTLVFQANGQQIAADFVDDVMVRYTVTSK
jgi:hypothetical protein